MADYWDSFRLTYGPFTLFFYVVNLIVGPFLVYFIVYHPYGTALDYLGISLSVVIILIMVLDPVIEALNEPKIRLGLGHQDMEDNERRFYFQVENFGRRPATNAKMEFRILLIHGLNPGMKGYRVFDHAIIPFFSEESENWFTPTLTLELFYNSRARELRFEWLKPKTDTSPEDIVYENITKGPFNVENAEMEFALTWEFAGKSGFLGKRYTMDWRPNGIDNQPFPNIFERKR